MRAAFGRLACAVSLLLALPQAARAQTEAPEVPDEQPIAPRPSPIKAPPISLVLPAQPAPEPPAAPPVMLSAAPQSGVGAMVGVDDGRTYFRAPDGSFVIFPTGRVHLDSRGYYSRNDTPSDTFALRNARLEATGWTGSWIYFSLAVEYSAPPSAPTSGQAAPSGLAATDDYVALAPWRNLAILQVGQFDAPFTLENRTPEKNLDFMERSITVRAFGIPDNREVGAMVHGYDEGRRFHYSLGVFNGDGLNFNNPDHQFDAMGRAWIAPFAFAGGGLLHDVSIGGSGWVGDRANTVAPAAQTTQGGFPFLSFAPYGASPVGAGGQRLLQLRQVGLLRAFAGEVNVPVAHRFGARAELVWRHSPLSEEDVTTSAAPFIVGGADLTGWAAYGELWFWAIGNDRLIGDVQGLEPFNRYRDAAAEAPVNGLMMGLRLERLDEQVTYEPDAATLDLRDPAVGRTQVTSLEVAANYWHTRRFRASLDYVFNHLQGDTRQMQVLSSPNVHEIGLRLAIAL